MGLSDVGIGGVYRPAAVLLAGTVDGWINCYSHEVALCGLSIANDDHISAFAQAQDGSGMRDGLVTVRGS